MQRPGWTADRLPRLDGTRVVVTGASNGVGLETARALAGAGAHVLLAVRDPALGRRRAAEIGGSCEVVELDLADLASVRACAEAITDPIDVLVNNAGVYPLRREDTADGFELALGTNVLGPYALTALLLPRITDRVVNVASNSHKAATIDRADPHLRRRWSGPRAYAGSKLALLAWTLDLDRRLRESGSPVRALAAEPGWAASNISNKPGLGAVHRIAQRVALTIGNDLPTAARSTLFAVAEPMPGGAYVGFDGVGTFRGRVALIGRSAEASDPRVGAWFTAFAARETGVTVAPPRPG
ncbi:SDR family NAD(P)-dependent oxidoreductase [Pseudactinotalea sp.]|uniref:SDR family NAD(P)-dependent oxidoreductase n=1 Tax=Pseudactinotalea sp. TaxID=1926260 RepID=UPI003B3BDCE5